MKLSLKRIRPTNFGNQLSHVTYNSKYITANLQLMTRTSKGILRFFSKFKKKKNRQMISRKFPKSFRGAGDLVVFYEFLSYFSGFFQTSNKITEHHQVTSIPKTLGKLTSNHLPVLIKFREKSKLPFLYVPRYP